MRSIGVITSGRADYSIYRPILLKILAARDLELQLYVTGTHLSPHFGMSVDLIRDDGLPIAETIDCIAASDDPIAVDQAMAAAIDRFAIVYAKRRPDIVLALGDRYEMLAAVLAAVPFNIPIAHIHGGEVTEGAIDDAFRHAISKLSHMHFTSTEATARRLRQLGEEDWRVLVAGAPALDAIKSISLLNREELSQAIGVKLADSVLLVTQHPVTREDDNGLAETMLLLEALSTIDTQIIFTQPNADPGGRAIEVAILEFVASGNDRHLVKNLGAHRYFSLLNLATAMVGNSSSGIIEAATFGLPVVDIGSRQAGRQRGANVIDVNPSNAGDIGRAIDRVRQPSFRQALEGLANPYGDGCATERIIHSLRNAKLGPLFNRKLFIDRDGEW